MLGKFLASIFFEVIMLIKNSFIDFLYVFCQYLD